MTVTPSSPADPPADRALGLARRVIEQGCSDAALPTVRTFFDEATSTATHVVHDPATGEAAIIDSVLDFDPVSGRTGHRSADQLIDYVEAAGLRVVWLLETHVHADHVSAAPYLRDRLGGRIAIGRGIVGVQRTFGPIFDMSRTLSDDGSEFDRLFDDGDSFAIGALAAVVLHVPGHTPADTAYVIGDAVFTGDTLFMPDYGTARTDFPGGDARALYRSIRRLLTLPSHTRLFLCHDYKAPGRKAYAWETTIGAQRTGNIHVHEGIAEEAFVLLRVKRDRTLAMPRLMLPAVQMNLRGGRPPEPGENGIRYLRIPLDTL